MKTKNYCFFHGNQAEYTGKSRTIHGEVYYEIKMLEGHRIGALLDTARPPADADARPILNSTRE